MKKIKRIFTTFLLICIIISSNATIVKAEENNNYKHLTQEEVNELLNVDQKESITQEELTILEDHLDEILNLTEKEEAAQILKDLGLEDKVTIEDITDAESTANLVQIQPFTIYPPGAFSVDFINKSSTDKFFYVTLYAINLSSVRVIQLADYVDYYVKPTNVADWIISYNYYIDEAGFLLGFDRNIHNFAYSYPPGGTAKYVGRFVIVTEYGKAIPLPHVTEHK